MTPSKFVKWAAEMLRHRRQFLLAGPPGIGKTALITQVTDSLGFDLIIEHANLCDPLDVKGIGFDSGKEYAEFKPFGNLWRAIIATKPTVYFADDFGMAKDAVQNSFIQMMHGKRIGTHTISDNVIFVIATNEIGQMAGVSGITETVKSRMHTLIKLEVNYEDWINGFALPKGMPAQLIQYIRNQPAALHEFTPTRDVTRNSPCPRTWEHVGDMLNDGTLDSETCYGAIGEGRGRDFMNWLELCDACISTDEVLLNPTGAAIPDKPDILHYLMTGLARRATRDNFETIMTYLMRLEQSVRMLCITDMIGSGNRTPMNTRAFSAWMAKEGSNLSLAV